MDCNQWQLACLLHLCNYWLSFYYYWMTKAYHAITRDYLPIVVVFWAKRTEWHNQKLFSKTPVNLMFFFLREKNRAIYTKNPRKMNDTLPYQHDISVLIASYQYYLHFIDRTVSYYYQRTDMDLNPRNGWFAYYMLEKGILNTNWLAPRTWPHNLLRFTWFVDFVQKELLSCP